MLTVISFELSSVFTYSSTSQLIFSSESSLFSSTPISVVGSEWARGLFPPAPAEFETASVFAVSNFRVGCSPPTFLSTSTSSGAPFPVPVPRGPRSGSAARLARRGPKTSSSSLKNCGRDSLKYDNLHYFDTT